jgi:hypothetical protein
MTWSLRRNIMTNIPKDRGWYRKCPSGQTSLVVLCAWLRDLCLEKLLRGCEYTMWSNEDDVYRILHHDNLLPNEPTPRAPNGH